MKYAINGRFIVRKQTGQERFATELISELDKIVGKNEFVLVVPEYAENIPVYSNIEVVKYGRVKSHLWEQINFYRYIRSNNLVSINLTTTCSLISPGIVCIHDAAYFEIADILTQNLYGKFSTVWHRFLARAAAKRAKIILTVSEYSKTKLTEILHPKAPIYVLRNAWQHYNCVVKDMSIFNSLSKEIKPKEYFMALSSLTPQKNFKWVQEVAKRNPKKQFVICGGMEGFTNYCDKSSNQSNLHYTGYLSDGQVKALMSQCRAFIHPAIYEGFGIPPLEALSCGAELILSNATCLPEIYGNSAHYVNPFDYNVDLELLLQEKIEDADSVLNKYSWASEAGSLLRIVKTI